MFLPPKLTSRRQFLGRSALGAGSILLTPLLLQSCTDHIIPDPTKPPSTPVHVPSAAGGNNYTEAAKAAILSELQQGPDVGGLLRALTSILWPSSGVDVWDQLRDQVQTLLPNLNAILDIPKTIPDSVYKDVKTNLASLKTLLDTYQITLINSTPTEIGNEWVRVTKYFVDSQHYYTVAGYELLLLPFFAQYASLYLALLRDGVFAGQYWGRTDADQQQTLQDLQAYIQTAVDHTTGRYTKVRTYIVNNTLEFYQLCEPFRSVNTYEREMTLQVLDFMTTWPYFDLSRYPNGVRGVLTREIYSDPFGSCVNGDPIVIKTPVPTQFPEYLAVTGWDLIEEIDLGYRDHSGPGGVSNTGEMGNSTYTTHVNHASLPYGNLFVLEPNNPITQFRVISLVDPRGKQGPYVLVLQFQFYDGTLTNLLGGRKLPADYETNQEYTDAGWIGYGHNALSSIHVNGLNDPFNTADGIVFGFKYWQPQ